MAGSGRRRRVPLVDTTHAVLVLKVSSLVVMTAAIRRGIESTKRWQTWDVTNCQVLPKSTLDSVPQSLNYEETEETAFLPFLFDLGPWLLWRWIFDHASPLYTRSELYLSSNPLKWVMFKYFETLVSLDRKYLFSLCEDIGKNLTQLQFKLSRIRWKIMNQLCQNFFSTALQS